MTTTGEVEDRGCDLFDTSLHTSLREALRQVDVATFEGEVKLIIHDVSCRVDKLEKAKVVSQELMDTLISV